MSTKAYNNVDDLPDLVGKKVSQQPYKNVDELPDLKKKEPTSNGTGIFGNIAKNFQSSGNGLKSSEITNLNEPLKPIDNNKGGDISSGLQQQQKSIKTNEIPKENNYLVNEKPVEIAKAANDLKNAPKTSPKDNFDGIKFMKQDIIDNGGGEHLKDMPTALESLNQYFGNDATNATDYFKRRTKDIDNRIGELNQSLSDQQQKRVEQSNTKGDIKPMVQTAVINKLTGKPFDEQVPDEEKKTVEEINKLKDYKSNLIRANDVLAKKYVNWLAPTGTLTERGKLFNKLTGDENAQEQQRLEDKGIPLTQEQQYNTDMKGLQTVHQQLEDEYADKPKDDAYYQKLAQLNTVDRGVLNKYPEFKRQQGGNLIAELAVKDPMVAMLAKTGSGELNKQMTDYLQKKYDVNPKDLKGLEYGDIPHENFFGNVAKEVTNAGTSLLTGAIRLGGTAIGIDEDRLSHVNNQISQLGNKAFGYNPYEHLTENPTLVNKDLQTIANPRAGKYNYNSETIKNAIGSGIGSLLGFIGGTKGVGKIASLSDDAAMTSYMIGSGAENNYHKAENILGKDASEAEKSLVSMGFGYADALAFKLLPKDKIFFGSAETKLAEKEFANSLKGVDINSINKEALEPKLTKLFKALAGTAEETTKIGGAMTAAEMAKTTASVMLGDNKNATKYMEEGFANIKGMLHDLPFSMAIPLGLMEIPKFSNHSNLFKETLFDAGNSPETHTATIRQAEEKGIISKEEADKKIEVVKTMKNVVKSTPTENPTTGEPLTHKQQVEYAYNRVKEIAQLAKKDNVSGDAALAQHYDKQAKELVDERKAILDGTQDEYKKTVDLYDRIKEKGTQHNVALNAGTKTEGVQYLADQSLQAPFSVKKSLGGDADLTTDLIARNSPEDIKSEIKDLKGKQKIADEAEKKAESNEYQRHIDLLEAGLEKTKPKEEIKDEEKLPTLSEPIEGTNSKGIPLEENAVEGDGTPEEISKPIELNPNDTSPKGNDVSVSDVEFKDEGLADKPTKENVAERLDVNKPFAQKVGDALKKLGVVSDDYILGGQIQELGKDGKEGFATGDMYFKNDGTISFVNAKGIVEFDKNGNVKSTDLEKDKVRTKSDVQKDIDNKTKQKQDFEAIRDSEDFKYKEETKSDPLGRKIKSKRLKTADELKESTDKINKVIDKLDNEISDHNKELETAPSENKPIVDEDKTKTKEPTQEVNDGGNTGNESIPTEETSNTESPITETVPSSESGDIESGKAKGITHAAVDELRKIIDLPEYEGKPVETHEQLISEAQQTIKDNPNAANEVLDKMGNGGKITNKDNAIVAVYKATIDAEMAKNPTLELLKRATRLAKALDVSGTELGKALESRKLVGTEDNLTNFLLDKQAAQGTALTETQLKSESAKYEELKAAHDALEKQLEIEREQHSKDIAELGLNQAKAKARKSAKKSDADYKAERKLTVYKAREALKEIRSNPQSSTAPLFRELVAIAPHVKEFINSLASQGVDKLDNIISQAHAEFKDVLDGLTKRDVLDMMAGDYNGKPKDLTRNEKANTARLLEREAALLKQLERERKGEEKAKSETQKTQSNRRIDELKEKIKEVRRQNKNRVPDTESPEDMTAGEIEYNDKLQKLLIEKAQKLTNDIRNKKYLEEEPAKPVFKKSRKTQLLEDKVIDLENKIRHERSKDEYEKRGKSRKVFDKIMEVLGIRRLVQSAVDISVPFRQGATLISPRRIDTWAKAFGANLKSVFSPKKFERIMNDIRKDPQYHEMIKDNIVFNDMGSADPNLHNEDFRKSFIYKIPILSEPLNASNRSADAFLNYARYDMYKKMRQVMEQKGLTRESDPKAFKYMGNWVMNMTGRGKMHRSLEAPAMNAVLGNTFYGARLMASRFNLLNPVTYFDPRIPKQAKIEAMKDLASFTVTTMAIGMGLAAAGGKISLNPDDSDFLQVRFGDKVYDISGGLSNYIRTFMRIAKAGYVKATGTKYEGQKATDNAGQSVLNFFRNKLSPNTSYATDAFFGASYGRKFDPTDIVRIYPMYTEDVIKAVKEEGLMAIPTVLLPNILGIGYGSYASKGQIDKNLDDLLQRNLRSDEMNNEKMKNYNDKGRPITYKEFNAFADKRDAEIEKDIKVLYEKGAKGKAYKDLTPEEVADEIKYIKSHATTKVKEQMFGKQKKINSDIRNDKKLSEQRDKQYNDN